MKGIEVVREMIKTQAGDGNWNFDAYQHGMYNGLELALATIEGRALKFKAKPEEWLRDKIMTDIADAHKKEE